MPRIRLEPNDEGVNWKCDCGWSFHRSPEHGSATVCPGCHRLTYGSETPEPEERAP